MDKNEQMLKMDELRDAMRNREFDKAVDIADSLDLKKIKDNNFLSIVADAYEVTHNYEDAKDVLMTAYENTNAGRLIAYKLCLVSIKTKDFGDARKYYDDFVEMAPRDTARYVLKYRMAKAQHKPIEELIDILEEYINIDMEEKWAYELAKLYSKAGEKEKCIDICDEISLWFAEGKYVNKAIALKKKYSKLTDVQQEKYEENKKEEETKKQVEEAEAKNAEEVIEITDAEHLKNINKEKPVNNNDSEDEIQQKSFKRKKKRPFSINPEMIEKASEDIGQLRKPEMEIIEIKDDEEVINDLSKNNTFAGYEQTEDADMEEILLNDDILENKEADTKEDDKTPAKEELDLEKGTDSEKEENSQAHDDKLQDVSGEFFNDSEDENKDEYKTEKLTNIKDVGDILRQLQERGILKAETVQQAVDIIGDAEETGKTSKSSDTDSDMSENVTSEEVKINEEDEAKTTKGNETTSDENIVDEVILEKDADNTADLESDNLEGVDPQIAEFDDSDIILEEDLEKGKTDAQTVQPEGTSQNLENTRIFNTNADDIGNTRIFNKQDVLNADVPKVSKAVRPDTVVPSEEVNTIEDEHVPALDLEFEKPKRDVSNDIGQNNIYKNIAENSDLGYKTDKLPTRDELQAAIKKAEKVVANNENQEQPEVHIKVEPTSKVEVLSGAGIVEEGEIALAKEEKTKTSQIKQESPKVDIVENNESKPEVSVEETVADVPVESVTEEKKETKTNNEVLEENKEDKQQKDESGKTENKEVLNKTNEVTSDDILSEAELTEFKNYLNVEGLETNIREVLQNLIVNYTPNGKSDEGNVIIMGNEKTGKTTLAVEMIKLVNRKRGRRNRKLAKVDANVLNKKGFRYALTKLVGCDLIVENAEQLGKMTVSDLIDGCGMFTDDMLIVLEGNMDGMEELVKTSPRLESVFNHVIKIKEYDIKEWVEYGKQYALEKGYALDELANLAFYKAIDDFFGANKGISQNDVEGIVDNAINKSGRLGRKFKGIFSSKSEQDGLHTLEESDFDI